MNQSWTGSIQNLISVRDKMLQKCKELEDELDKTMREIDDSKQFYDSSTATYIREQSNELILRGRKYIENDFTASIEKLNIVIDAYSNYALEVNSVVANRGKKE